jgi:hypothetical protein
MIQTNFVFSYQTNYRALHYHSEGVVYCCSDFQPRARNLDASASVRRRSKLTYKVFGGCKLLLFADEKGVTKRQFNILLAIVGRPYTVLCRTICLSDKHVRKFFTTEYMKVEIRTVFHTALISFYQQLKMFSISRFLQSKGAIFFQKSMYHLKVPGTRRLT